MTDLAAGGHRLLPHEHGLAVLVLRRNAEHRSASVLRHEHNLGQAGIVVAAAGLTNLLASEVLVLAGIMLLTFCNQISIAVAAGAMLFTLAVGLVGLTVVRLRQAAAIGRDHRGGRPPVRR
jgi:hypothetical protein